MVIDGPSHLMATRHHTHQPFSFSDWAGRHTVGAIAVVHGRLEDRHGHFSDVVVEGWHRDD